LKKGSPSEAELSFKTLSIIGITLGTESEEIFKDISPLLEIIIKETDKEPSVRASAQMCLTSLYFIACTDEHSTLAYMANLQSLFNSNLAQSSLKCWGLLATSVIKQNRHSLLLPQSLKSLVALLDNSDLEIKLAAGENIALLIETERELCDEEFDINSLHELVDVEDMLNKLCDLANDRNRFQAKKDIIKQRTGFKEIYKYIESNELEEMKLYFNKQPVIFDTWVKLKQLAYLREIIGEGLSIHFVENEFLQDVFDTKISAEEKSAKLSAVEKRLTYGTANKVRTQNRNKNRQIRQEEIIPDEE